MDTEAALQAFEQRMQDAEMPRAAVAAFERMYRAYREGKSGKTPWDEVGRLGPGELTQMDAVEGEGLAAEGRQHARQLVWIVLNGGLGTSMKMDRAKSLLPVKDGASFLDLLVRHVIALRGRWQVPLPLLFMNSFATRDDTLAVLEHHDLVGGGDDAVKFPVDFLQHQFPRIRVADGLPFGKPGERAAWAPPGHGNLYLALWCSGLLERLLASGYRWAFVSNADNLGASVHAGILGYLAQQGLEFAMEVTDKTAADVKGGTLIRRNGRVSLLELAQVPEEHAGEFMDTEKFPVFNTNNLWIDLAALKSRLARASLELPLIVNRKVVDGVPVAQLESAMGAAIGSFARSAGVRVPRSRFAPVKTTDDLLVRRSDAYLCGAAAPLVPNPARPAELGPPVVRLDREFFGAAGQLDERIPAPLSLLAAERLEVAGDVRFAGPATVRGVVRVAAAPGQSRTVPAGAVLDDAG